MKLFPRLITEGSVEYSDAKGKVRFLPPEVAQRRQVGSAPGLCGRLRGTNSMQDAIGEEAARSRSSFPSSAQLMMLVLPCLVLRRLVLCVLSQAEPRRKPFG
jgi:hypothetical protein